MITAARIVVLCPGATPLIVAAVAPALEALRERYGVDTPLRVAHLMAQLAHESGGFAHLVENLNYSAKRIPQVFGSRLKDRAAELARNPERLANAAYANRIGNGDEASGDGWRFRGRGLIQLTGRANYRSAGQGLDIDLEASPERAADPRISAELALHYWRKSGCNEAADLDDVAGVTRKINGPAMAGLPHRMSLTARAKEIFRED